MHERQHQLKTRLPSSELLDMACAWRYVIAMCLLSMLTNGLVLDNGLEVKDAPNQTVSVAREASREPCPEFGPLEGTVFLRQEVLSVLYTVSLYTHSATLGTVSRTLFSWGAVLELCNADGSLVATLKQGIFEDDAELLDCHGQGMARISRQRMSSPETGDVEGYRLENLRPKWNEDATLGETLEVPGWFLDPLSTAIVSLRNKKGELQMHLEQESALVPYGWDMKIVKAQLDSDAQVFTLFAGMLFPGIMWTNLGPGLFIWICVIALCACAGYLYIRLGGHMPLSEDEDSSDDSPRFGLKTDPGAPQRAAAYTRGSLELPPTETVYTRRVTPEPPPLAAPVTQTRSQMEEQETAAPVSQAFRCCLGPAGQGTPVEVVRTYPPTWERRPFLELEPAQEA